MRRCGERKGERAMVVRGSRSRRDTTTASWKEYSICIGTTSDLRSIVGGQKNILLIVRSIKTSKRPTVLSQAPTRLVFKEVSKSLGAVRWGFRLLGNNTVRFGVYIMCMFFSRIARCG